MKKQLLYIGRPNLGENMFATPCIDLLSKEYDITFLGPYHTLPVFRHYPFIKRALQSCNTDDPRAILPFNTRSFLKELIKSGEWYYAYHNDLDINFLPNHLELQQLKKYPVLHDKEIKIYSNSYKQNAQLNSGDKNINTGFFLSRTKKYMLKLQLLSLAQTETYDCTVRCPTFLTEKTSEDIVIYEGSKECLRKLPIETISKFISALPGAIYLVTQDTANRLNLKEKKINYLLTSSSLNYFSPETLIKIIKLFETRPKALIGPDSGLTQLASGYKIPLIWLQSRIALENVIDYQYKKYCKVYFKSRPSCKLECVGCAAVKALRTNTLSYGLFRIEEILKEYKSMDCFINAKPDCLYYEDNDIAKIIKLCNE